MGGSLLLAVSPHGNAILDLVSSEETVCSLKLIKNGTSGSL